MAKAKMLNIKVFRANHEELLAKEAQVQPCRYDRRKPWAVGRNESKTCIDSGYQIPEDLHARLKMPTAKDSHDIANAIILHKSLSHLSRRDASDPMLWARLCHVELWTYMRRRFDLAKVTGTKKTQVIGSRYFVLRNNSRALMRNGLARLWWAGRLTCDSSATGDARYLLTEVLLKRLDITKNLVERSYGRSPKVLRVVLRFIHTQKANLLAPGNICRRRSRVLFRRLNELGGVALLDELSESDIDKFLQDTLAAILAAEPSGPKRKAKATKPRRRPPKGK